MLHSACRNGCSGAVSALIEKGADIHAVNKVRWRQVGWTPLYSASFGGHVAAVRLLLDAGADIAATEEVSSDASRCAL